MADDRTGETVGYHLAVGEHDDPVGHLGHQFDVMGRHDDTAAPGRELAELVGQSLLGAVVETARGLVEQQQRWLWRQHYRQREREALTFGEVLRVRVDRYA